LICHGVQEFMKSFAKPWSNSERALDASAFHIVIPSYPEIHALIEKEVNA